MQKRPIILSILLTVASPYTALQGSFDGLRALLMDYRALLMDSFKTSHGHLIDRRLLQSPIGWTAGSFGGLQGSFGGLRALLTDYRALLRDFRDFLIDCRALLRGSFERLQGSFDRHQKSQSFSALHF